MVFTIIRIINTDKLKNQYHYLNWSLKASLNSRRKKSNVRKLIERKIRERRNKCVDGYSGGWNV
jgi:hypothetical protein